MTSQQDTRSTWRILIWHLFRSCKTFPWLQLVATFGNKPKEFWNILRCSQLPSSLPCGVTLMFRLWRSSTRVIAQLKWISLQNVAHFNSAVHCSCWFFLESMMEWFWFIRGDTLHHGCGHHRSQKQCDPDWGHHCSHCAEKLVMLKFDFNNSCRLDNWSCLSLWSSIWQVYLQQRVDLRLFPVWFITLVMLWMSRKLCG